MTRALLHLYASVLISIFYALVVSSQGVQLRIVSLLTEGPCVGLVEVLTVGYGQACSMDFGGPEASVVCRQVGCGPFGARRVSADLFGFDPENTGLYVPLPYTCDGSEAGISSCMPNNATVCNEGQLQSAVAVNCGSFSQVGAIVGGVIAGIVFLVVAGFIIGVLVKMVC